MRLCDIQNGHYYYAEAEAAQKYGGSDENAVFDSRRMSGLIAFNRRASATKNQV